MPAIIPKINPIIPESIQDIPISHIDDINFCPITSKTGLLYIIEVPQSPLIIDLNQDQNLIIGGLFKPQCSAINCLCSALTFVDAPT